MLTAARLAARLAARPMARRAACRLALLAPALLGGCSGGVLDPRGPVGAADRTILLDSLAIMLAIVVPVIVGTLVVAWWFRAGNARARYRPEWAFSGRIELVVWSIPLMTIVLLGGVAWVGSHRLDPAAPLDDPGRAGAPVEIQAVSLDWKWLFIYPAEGVASLNRLVVPAGRNLHFSLTSASVMNTFFVPQLGSMIYTMNGMATELNLRADRPGDLRGISGHYSGAGFSDMHFEVSAVTPAAFDAWTAGARAGGGVLDTEAYNALAVPSAKVPPASFAAVEPQLFARIVAQAIPPGPGPADTATGSAGSTKGVR